MEEYAFSAASSAKAKTTTQTVDVSIQQAFECCKNFSRDSEKAEAINNNVLEFIALHGQPFPVVENQGFSKLIAHLEPRYTLSG